MKTKIRTSIFLISFLFAYIYCFAQSPPEDSAMISNDSIHAISDTTIQVGDSVIHIGDSPTPPLFYKELPNSTGGTIGTFLWSLLGLTIYFFCNFSQKRDRENAEAYKTPEKFSGLIWWKDNRMTLLLYCVGFAFMFWNAGAVHPIVAISLGISPAFLIDTAKRKLGKTT